MVYRYSLLQQDDGKDNAYENALAAKPIVYEDSSDDEVNMCYVNPLLR